MNGTCLVPQQASSWGCHAACLWPVNSHWVLSRGSSGHLSWTVCQRPRVGVPFSFASILLETPNGVSAMLDERHVLPKH